MISNLITYYVNSANRINDGSDTDNFNYLFNISNDLYNDIDHVSITEISIPKSFYVI